VIFRKGKECADRGGKGGPVLKRRAEGAQGIIPQLTKEKGRGSREHRQKQYLREISARHRDPFPFKNAMLYRARMRDCIKREESSSFCNGRKRERSTREEGINTGDGRRLWMNRGERARKYSEKFSRRRQREEKRHCHCP